MAIPYRFGHCLVHHQTVVHHPRRISNRTSNLAGCDNDVARNMVDRARVAVDYREHQRRRIPARIIWFLGSDSCGLANHLGIDRAHQN